MKIILPLLLTFFVASVQAATQHDIEIIKYKFSPAEITVEVGDLIRWTNKEKRQYHSVWFEKLGEPEPDYFFPDEFYERTFDKVGDFPYRCGPHPKMTGVVHVLQAKGNDDNKESKKVATNSTSYRVESVEDGDTIVIQYKGKSQRVQLIGINAPEDIQNPKLTFDSKTKKIDKTDLLAVGKLATDHLKTLVNTGEKVSLLGDLTEKDKYNRLPAIVVDEKGKSLNEAMVKNGYAILLTRFALDDDLKTSFKKAQEQAQTEKSGLWGSHPELMAKWSN